MLKYDVFTIEDAKAWLMLKDTLALERWVRLANDYYYEYRKNKRFIGVWRRKLRLISASKATKDVTREFNLT